MRQGSFKDIMMKKKLLNFGLFILLFIVNPHISNGQIKQERKANKQFDTYSYSDAIETYLKIVKKGKATTETYAKLGDAFYFNAKLLEANKWYSELFNFSDNSKINGQHYFRYAQTLKAVGQDSQAESILTYWMNNYATDQERKYYIETVSGNHELVLKNEQVKLSAVSFNSNYSDYGAFATNNSLLFTSSRPISNNKNIDRWTNEFFTSILEISSSEEQMVVPMELEHFSQFVNHSSAVLSNDRMTMFFTINNVSSKGKKRHNKKGDSLLKIFKATKNVNGTWGKIEELSINSDDFNTAHPSLSPDEKYLYFSSDRPGGYGESDLYKVELSNLTPINQVINLGETINTGGRETFPFITEETLYFSSDYRIGFGGLDIFKVNIKANDSYGEVQNLGEQFNSPFDDFAYFKLTKNSGYISSNRPNDLYKSDNIYAFSICGTEFFGKVKDQQTLNGIGNSMLRFQVKDKKQIFDLLTDEKGSFYTEELMCNEEYAIVVESKGYESKTIHVSFDDMITVKEQDILLTLLNDRQWNDIKIDPIFFNFDRALIRLESVATLNKLLTILETYPKAKIEVRSHTDSRGSDAYNLILSEKRARETTQWLIDNGIDKTRITYKAMGESELLNNCDNSTPCSNEKHAVNRRSEFKIIMQQ